MGHISRLNELVQPRPLRIHLTDLSLQIFHKVLLLPVVEEGGDVEEEQTCYYQTQPHKQYWRAEGVLYVGASQQDEQAYEGEGKADVVEQGPDHSRTRSLLRPDAGGQ